MVPRFPLRTRAVAYSTITLRTQLESQGTTLAATVEWMRHSHLTRRGEPTRIDGSSLFRRLWLATAIVFCLVAFGSASESTPAVREHLYTVNAKVRLIPLVWIGRDNIGGARITRRRDASGRRTVEFLIGSDPVRAPRRINRWGFIIESVNPDNTEVLGAMKESNEETLEEAEAQSAGRDHGASTFKAVRSTISGSRAVGGTMTVRAPANLTYREIDLLLALIPPKSPKVRTVELPPGTQIGFLAALDSLIDASIDRCGSTENTGARQVSPVPYVYNQALYDVSLSSCEYKPQLRTKTGTFSDVVDARFEVRNQTTHYETTFHLFVGASGEVRGLPLRAIFRPRSWLEVELVLDRSAAGIP